MVRAEDPRRFPHGPQVNTYPPHSLTPRHPPHTCCATLSCSHCCYAFLSVLLLFPCRRNAKDHPTTPSSTTNQRLPPPPPRCLACCSQPHTPSTHTLHSTYSHMPFPDFCYSCVDWIQVPINSPSAKLETYLAPQTSSSHPHHVCVCVCKPFSHPHHLYVQTLLPSASRVSVQTNKQKPPLPITPSPCAETPTEKTTMVKRV